MTWPTLIAALTFGALTALVAILGLVVAAVILYAVLPWVVQPMLRVMLRLRYRVKVVGRENVPKTGPLLVASNHLSWLDGFFLAGFTPRRGRALVSAGLVSGPIVKPIAVRAGIIPTPYTGPHAIREALNLARAALDEGAAIGIFPEGQISRSGMLGPFQRGIELILKGKTDARVVPVAIDNLWGSVFSNSDGRFFRKWPKGFRRTVVIVYGPPLAPPVTAFALRQAVTVCSVQARTITGVPSHALETLDPALPRWEHPTLGMLTASTPDIRIPSASVFQAGVKEGTVGLTVPGVALRVVDGAGVEQPAETEGRLEALVPGGSGWADTGRVGRIARDGFVSLSPADPA